MQCRWQWWRRRCRQAAHLLHVNAAGQQVGGDEDAGGAGAELAHDDVAGVLWQGTGRAGGLGGWRGGKGKGRKLETVAGRAWLGGTKAEEQSAWAVAALDAGSDCLPTACPALPRCPAAQLALLPSTPAKPPHSAQIYTLNTATPLTWSMSPWVADTVWSRSRILSVSQSTCRQGRQEAGRGGGQRVGGELRWLGAAGAAVHSCSSPATPAAPPKHTRLAAAPPPPTSCR